MAFNAEPFIERTIQSVLAQNYDNIEYLIIDGNSKDRTVDIIKQYESEVDFWMSEPDKSHFDAMNKGIARSSGEYVLILNAGDRLKDANSLVHVMNGSDGADFIYSRAVYIDEAGNTRPWHKKTPLPEKLSKTSFLMGMVICHHCMIIKKEFVPQFVLEPWKVSNDLDWSIKIMDRIQTVHFWDDIFCLYLEGGISTKQMRKAVKERFDICVTHFGIFSTLIAQVKIAFEIIQKKIMR